MDIAARDPQCFVVLPHGFGVRSVKQAVDLAVGVVK
jgi:hypothetical protein